MTSVQQGAAPRVALITGGNRGLGRAMAEHLAAAGCDVVLTARGGEGAAADALAAIRAMGRRAAAIPLNLSETSGIPGFVKDLESVIAGFGAAGLDILVNNAGFGLHKAFADTTAEDLDALYTVHLKGPFLLSAALLPLLRDGARILNVSTGLARFSLPGYAAYASMKGAVEVMTRYMARELGPRRISVNTIAPGAIETDFGGGAVRDNADLNRMIAGFTAQGRAGLPDDIGGAVTALLDPGAGWITGQRIEVSGGMFL